MKLQRTVSSHPGLLVVLPVVDVVFILLLFFVLSSGFLLQPGIPVSVPVSPFIVAPQENPRIISITGGPEPRIYFEDQQLELAELRHRLDLSTDRTRSAIVKADKGAPHDLVVQVANICLSEGLPVVIATSPEK